MPTAAKMPAHLGTEGRLLWREIAGKYELRPDEVRLLTDACREADVIERLEVALRGSELMVRGSQGQLVSSPLVSEVRQHRSVLAGLLKALRLPESDESAQDKAKATVTQARAAARARWDRRGSATG